MELGFGFAIVLLAACMFFKQVINKLNDVIVKYLDAAEKHAEHLGNSFEKDD